MVFGGIYDAIVAGDWALAGNIMWTALKIAWQTGIGGLLGLWVNFKFSMFSIFDVLVTGFRSKWNSVSTFLAKGIIWLIDKANAASEALTGAKLIDLDTAAMSKMIDQNNERFQKQIVNDQVKREQERIQQIAEQKKKLGTEELKAELAQMVSQAQEKRAQFDAELEQPAGPTEAQKAAFNPPTLKDLGSTSTAIGGGASQSALGSFSLSALDAFATKRTTETRNIAANERTADAAEEMRDAIEDSEGLVITE